MKTSNNNSEDSIHALKYLRTNALYISNVDVIKIRPEEDEVLKVLEDCINIYIERREQYGDWKKNINNAIEISQYKLTPENYLDVMISWKKARNGDKFKRDSMIDEIIYTIMLYLIKQK